MIKRFVLLCLTVVVFFVTIGVPVFHHECTEKNTTETKWFIFNESSCQCEQMPSCCRKNEKPNCCSVRNTIVALKVDQAYAPFDISFLSFYVINKTNQRFIVNLSTDNCHLSIVQNAKPPPKREYGVQLLKRNQVFRL